MEDEDEVQTLPTPPANAAISYGEAIAASKEAKAAGVARGNIQVLDESAETLQMPQVSALQATLSAAAAASQVTAAVLRGEVASLPTILGCCFDRRAYMQQRCKKKPSETLSSGGE